jgi:RNA polymerase sigma-70 factor
MDNSYDQFLGHFARDHKRLFAYIYSLLPNAADAEDVFQRTSLILWRKFDQFEAGEEFFNWACGVAFYEVRNFLRVSARQRLRFSDEVLAGLAAERPASLGRHDVRLAALTECLKKLSAQERRLVDCAYGSGMSVKQLADELGRAAQTLYNRLGAIRHRLLECVQRAIEAEGSAS